MTLPIWHSILSGNCRVAFLGDSTVSGIGSFSYTNFPAEIRTLYASRGGTGGLGFIGTNLQEGITITTGGNAWATPSVGDAWDKTAWLSVRSGSGSGKTITIERAMPNGFYLYCVDGTSAAQFSYSIDGGAYTNITGFSFAGTNNLMRSSLVASAVTTSVAIRAANAAGTSAQVYFAGIEPVTNTGQMTVDNWGAAGHTLNGDTNAASVTRGQGTVAALAEQISTVTGGIDLLAFMFTNDAADAGWSASRFRTALNLLQTQAVALSFDLLPMNYFARNDISVPILDELRAEIHDFADDNGWPCVDLRDSYDTYAAANSAGFMADGAHPSQAGNVYIAGQVWDAIAKPGLEARVRV